MSGVIFAPGVTTFSAMQAGLSLQYARAKSPTFNFFSPQLENTTMYISSTATNMYIESTGAIMWNPTLALQVIAPDGSRGVQSPTMQLVHEIAHKLFGHSEAQATAWETTIAREIGEPIRASYTSTGDYVKVQNSTQHSENGVWMAFNKLGKMYSGGPFYYDHPSGMGNGLAPPGPPLNNGGYSFPMGQVFINDNVRIDTSYPYQPPPGTYPLLAPTDESSLMRVATFADLENENDSMALADMLYFSKSQVPVDGDISLMPTISEPVSELSIHLVGISQEIA
jgi:hypothetical protein